MAYVERVNAEYFDVLDRQVTAFTWGTAIAHDSKGRNARKWARIRRRERGRATGESPALASVALERQIAALAAAHPEYVVTEGAP